VDMLELPVLGDFVIHNRVICNGDPTLPLAASCLHVPKPNVHADCVLLAPHARAACVVNSDTNIALLLVRQRLCSTPCPATSTAAAARAATRTTMSPPLQSLVRYDNPVLVSTSKGKGATKGSPGKKVWHLEAPSKQFSERLSTPRSSTMLTYAHALRCVQGALPPVEQKPGLTQTEDILNSILPPRYHRHYSIAMPRSVLTEQLEQPTANGTWCCLIMRAFA
jgi:hypothetical protein